MLALRFAVVCSVEGSAAVPDLAQGVGGTLLLLTVMGLGVTRLLLPEGLRRHEALWVLPTGACATALTMTVLGFLRVPFLPNLALTLTAGAALSLYALRRRPPQGRARAAAMTRRTSWPFWIALLLVAVALIPLFRAGFATVGGQGQDAHLAVGSAMFLQHNHPTAIDPSGPVDRMPLVWRSKQPIYYTLAAAATVSGLEVFETISAMAAVLLGLAAIGFFLFAREVLQAPRWAALAGMALVGIDRMVLHTVLHPYFNQTWGFMAMPFAFVLTWWAVKERSRGGLALLGAFMLVIAFAYPLAAPIPLIPVVVVLWPQRRRAWERLRGLYKGRRTLLWLVPTALVLFVPFYGVAEKIATGAGIVVDPTRSLENWGGDLKGWFREPFFFGVETWAAFVVVLPALLYGVHLCLREQPAPLRKGLWGVLAFTVAFTVLFRVRDYGWYFHFKLLAFVAPFVLVAAVAGLARLRRPRLAYLATAVLVVLSIGASNKELGSTYDQLPRFVLQLREIDRDLPGSASIRLDVIPDEQNWTAFWLHSHPLTSQTPLLGTSYPHVPEGRVADYILTKKDAGVPVDAGPAVTRLDAYTLYRAKPGIPGPKTASRTMVQTVEQITN